MPQSLRERREKKKLSQRELAKRAQVPYQGVCDIEKGRREPTPGWAERIGNELGLSVYEVYVRYFDSIRARKKLVLARFK